MPERSSRCHFAECPQAPKRRQGDLCQAPSCWPSEIRRAPYQIHQIARVTRQVETTIARWTACFSNRVPRFRCPADKRCDRYKSRLSPDNCLRNLEKARLPGEDGQLQVESCDSFHMPARVGLEHLVSVAQTLRPPALR